jgi:Zn-dependent protease
MNFSSKELRDLIKAWLAITIAFTIASTGFRLGTQMLSSFLVFAFTVGLGFIVHELAHRTLARRYRCHAEFRSFDKMLVVAILMSFFGFVFAAPGAVLISGHVTRSQRGKISASGPASNLLLALLFLVIAFTTSGVLKAIAIVGLNINTMLGFFNLLPFAGFDGSKVLSWNKAVYIALISIAGILMLVQPLLAL